MKRAARAIRRPARAGWHRRLAGLLSLGVVVGMGSVGTLAYWTDEATLETGRFRSGTLDITLNDQLAGQGGTWTDDATGMTSMVPGESQAFTVRVQRPADSVGFDYAVAATASGDLASALRWSVHPGGRAGSAQTSNGLRTNTCSGEATFSAGTLGGNAKEVVSSRAALRSGSGAAEETVCIRVALPADADNTAQGKSGAATFTFSATQAK